MQSKSKLGKLCLLTGALLLGANSNGAAPLILSQPQDTIAIEGSNITLAVEVKLAQSAVTDVSSGALRLWLKADSGVVVDSSNRVSQWQDFSGLTNHCFQTNVNKQPQLASGFNGKTVVRFDGIQDANVGDYLQGTGNVGLTDGFTAFLVYTKADRAVGEETPMMVGVPNSFNSVRGFYVRGISGIPNEMAFSGWANDYGSGFRIPVLTPRIWTERLATNKTQIDFFDTDGTSNFSTARLTHGLLSPGNGYYVGGLGSQTRNFKGDIAEAIYYHGALSGPDRTLVEDYLREKYFSTNDSALITYQWRFNGTNIAGATNASLTFDPVQLVNQGSYSVVVGNSAGSVTSSNAFLTVIPINRPPAADAQSFLVNEDSTLPVTLGAADPDGDELVYTVTGPGNGTLSGIAPQLVYTPNPNFHGTDSFTFQVNDGKTDSPVATINITVVSVNDAPSAASQSVSVNEDNSIALTLIASDADGDALTYHVSSPANGVLSGTAPNLVYTPNLDFHGSDNFTFSVNDGELDSAIATINMEVVSVNDVPIAVAKATPAFLFSSNETSTVIIAPCDGDVAVVLDASQSHDLEGDPLEYFWSEGTNVFAFGKIVTNTFAVGTHSLLLTAADNSDSGFTNLILEVITPAQAVAELIVFVDSSDLSDSQKSPLLASLNAAVASFARCNSISGTHQLEAFQHKVNAQIVPLDASLAENLLHISNEIIGSLQSTPAQVKSEKSSRNHLD